jgi:oligopeptidase B
VPVRKGGWWWYSRTEEGKQYGIHCRKPAAACRRRLVGRRAG